MNKVKFNKEANANTSKMNTLEVNITWPTNVSSIEEIGEDIWETMKGEDFKNNSVFVNYTAIPNKIVMDINTENILDSQTYGQTIDAIRMALRDIYIDSDHDDTVPELDEHLHHHLGDVYDDLYEAVINNKIPANVLQTITMLALGQKNVNTEKLDEWLDNKRISTDTLEGIMPYEVYNELLKLEKGEQNIDRESIMAHFIDKGLVTFDPTSDDIVTGTDVLVGIGKQILKFIETDDNEYRLTLSYRRDGEDQTNEIITPNAPNHRENDVAKTNNKPESKSNVFFTAAPCYNIMPQYYSTSITVVANKYDPEALNELVESFPGHVDVSIRSTKNDPNQAISPNPYYGGTWCAYPESASVTITSNIACDNEKLEKLVDSIQANSVDVHVSRTYLKA